MRWRTVLGRKTSNSLSDSLSSMYLLKSMQRGGLPLSLHRYPARQLLLHVVKLLKRRAGMGHITRLVKIVHTEESRSINSQTRWPQQPPSLIQHALLLDQDPAAVYFLRKETWV